MHCEAFGCANDAHHYTNNPATGRGFHLCYFHMSYHTQGIAFDLEPAKPAEAVLTGSGPTAILTLPAHTIATAEEAPMAYNNALSTLIDARSEAEDGIREIRDRIDELQSASEELESAIDTLNTAIEALEELDGFSVSVDVESLSVDVSVYL